MCLPALGERCQVPSRHCHSERCVCWACFQHGLTLGRLGFRQDLKSHCSLCSQIWRDSGRSPDLQQRRRQGAAMPDVPCACLACIPQRHMG